MLLELSELGHVIASRTLSFADNGNITVRIGQPFIPPDYGNNFCCPYQIEGIGDGKIRYGSGIDSLQALYLALMSISTDLYTSDESQAGKVTWEGDRDLGLPFLDTIKDLAPARESNPPCLVKVIKDKAQLFRDSANSRGLAFIETDIVGRPDLVQFAFNRDFAEVAEFLSSLPIEIFANRAIVGTIV